MLKQVISREKLVPLRKFAKAGLYSTTYLSQLVQRRKLRAKKIGRNYYTCENWFNEYLETHAQDVKSNGYEELKAKEIDKISKKIILPREVIDKNKINYIVLPEGDYMASLKVRTTIFKTIAVSTAIFILAILNLGYLLIGFDRGRVAGDEEGRAEKINYENNFATNTAAYLPKTIKNLNNNNIK